jgi:dehydratase
MTKTSTSVLAGAALALVPLLGLAAPASAASQRVTYACQGKAAGQTSNLSLTQDVDATAPATVSAGGSLSIVLASGTNTIPASAGGYTIKSVKDFSLVVPIPANSTYVSATLSGGSGLNSTPTISKVGDTLVTTVPGPINGGATFQLPALTLNLTAGSAGTITSTLAGTSYTDPGLRFTATISVVGFPIDAPTACYPSPAPTLTSTTVS